MCLMCHVSSHQCHVFSVSYVQYVTCPVCHMSSVSCSVYHMSSESIICPVSYVSSVSCIQCVTCPMCHVSSVSFVSLWIIIYYHRSSLLQRFSLSCNKQIEKSMESNRITQISLNHDVKKNNIKLSSVVLMSLHCHH